ncbi:hypothetical protein CHIBA101_1873 [Actinomyces sp. Chiba101]|nr:hypothetical protein CHIBA101_1873 [Actinomyces sp. Chiba101]GAV93439.1 hypothetical protein ADENT20671_0182 [Actinomyces denticolens]
MVEIHALSGASGYTRYMAQTITVLNGAEAPKGTFSVVNGDLFFVKTQGTAHGMVEIHALSGASGYTRYMAQTITVLNGAEAPKGTFSVVNGDLFFVKTQGTARGMVEIHALSGASGYTRYMAQTITVLNGAEAPKGAFSVVNGDLFFVKTQGTARGMVEIHALSGASGYTRYMAQTITALGAAHREIGQLCVAHPITPSSPNGSPTGRLNAAIISIAERWRNGTYGGQCASWVQGIIRAAGGKPVYLDNFPWGYNGSWDRICTEVRTWGDVQPGDICQWIYPSQNSGHTAIITAGGNERTAQVIDSNFGYTQQINRGPFSRRCIGNYIYKIWRLD